MVASARLCHTGVGGAGVGAAGLGVRDLSVWVLIVYVGVRGRALSRVVCIAMACACMHLCHPPIHPYHHHAYLAPTQTLLGEGASVVLEGQKVVPTRTKEAGFAFKYNTVDEALKAIL